MKMSEIPEWAKNMPTPAQILEEIGNPQAIEHADSGVVQGLVNMVITHKTVWAQHKRKIGPYCCLEEFVLKHGFFWEWQPLREGLDLELGEIKQCYMNSHLAVVENPEQLVYVEGYGSTLMTFGHGWVSFTDAQDEMSELTLRTVEDGGDTPENWPMPTYFGIPFDIDYIERATNESGQYAVIDNWKNDYPLLADPDELKRAIHPDWA